MSPIELERAICKITGESRREIKRRGFQMVDIDLPDDADDIPAGVVDWDQLDAERTGLFP